MALLQRRQRRDASNPLVYLDITIGGEEAGRIVLELYKDVVPKVILSQTKATFGQRCSIARVSDDVYDDGMGICWSVQGSLSGCRRRLHEPKETVSLLNQRSLELSAQMYSGSVLVRLFQWLIELLSAGR